MNSNFKVMVVDDENIFRQALVCGINWENLGMQVVKDAKHAFDALDYIRDNPVDIVITDVRMPVKNGLEMIEDVQAMGKNPVFVLLTGYGEFEYARQALRLGVREYLVKPVDEETVVALMTKLRGELLQKLLAQGLAEAWTKEPAAAGQKGTVNHILQIIEDELGNEELSLKWISQHHIYLNENYLSKLFQREVGERFSGYLLRRRMRQAMEMLANSNAAVGQVAAATGFGDNAGYFSSVFKKYSSCTPTEYRKIFCG